MPDSTDDDRIRERFQLIANGPALFNVVVAGLELNIFELLADEPGTALERLAGATGIDMHRLRVLMLGLCATGLVVKTDCGYANHPVAQDLLASDAPDSWRHILTSWHRLYYPAFFHTTSALRAGTNSTIAAHEGSEPTLYQRLSHDPELEQVFHAAMSAFTLRTTDGLLNDPELRSVRHLLDVGGGDGTNARNFLMHTTGTTATVLDLPSVIDLAKERTPARLAGRMRFHAGNMLTEELPVGADGVLLSHLLDTISAEQALSLLGAAYELLPRGGRVFVYGFMADDDEQGGVLAARLSLYLSILATGCSMAWPAAEIAGWLGKVGFGRIRTTRSLPYEHGLIVAWKE